MEDSLSGLYDRAWLLWHESSTDIDKCAPGVAAFVELSNTILKHGVFSEGETQSDLNTQSLKYLSVSFYLADLLQRQPGMEERDKRLKQAQIHFKRFLSQLHQYELLGDKDLAVYERENSSEEVIPAADLLREELIERDRRSKAINERLMVIMERKRKGDFDDSDEDIEREVSLSALELNVLEALKSLKMIREELPMLEIMNKMKATGVGPPGPPAQRVDLWGPRRKSTKREIRDVVFRPGWNLPTMSIEEAGEIEMQYMVRPDGAGDSVVKSYGGPGYIHSPEDEHEEDLSDNSEDDDEKVKEKREWDEFNDENPTGWGNRHNMG